MQTDVPFPEGPVQLADVTHTAMGHLTAIYCLGGQALTLRLHRGPGAHLAPRACDKAAWLLRDVG